MYQFPSFFFDIIAFIIFTTFISIFFTTFRSNFFTNFSCTIFTTFRSNIFNTFRSNIFTTFRSNILTNFSNTIFATFTSYIFINQLCIIFVTFTSIIFTSCIIFRFRIIRSQIITRQCNVLFIFLEFCSYFLRNYFNSQNISTIIIFFIDILLFYLNNFELTIIQWWKISSVVISQQVLETCTGRKKLKTMLISKNRPTRPNSRFIFGSGWAI